jgi:hypothetical protein
MLIKTKKQKGMIKVINMEFYAPCAMVWMVSASSLLANCLGMLDDWDNSSILVESFVAMK